MVTFDLIKTVNIIRSMKRFHQATLKQEVNGRLENRTIYTPTSFD